MPDPSGSSAAQFVRSAVPRRAIFADYLKAIDERLMGCRPWFQRLVVLLLIVALAGTCLGYVPRAYVNYSGVPLLAQLDQPPEYGTDTIADMYEAKVVLHDWRDMYTKAGVEQTP